MSRRGGWALGLLAWWLVPGHLAAQCAMCGQAAASAGDPEQAASTFATAILVLLIPVCLLLSAAALLLWRFRHDPGGGYQEFDQPETMHAPGPAEVVPLPARRRQS
jgi:hypothetical protein